MRAKNEMHLSGWLTNYFAQGSEGRVDWAFMDASYSDANGWDETGITLLDEGHLLTLFNSDGTTLWAGTIDKVQTEAGEVFDRHGNRDALKAVFNDRDREPYSSWMPKGVAAQDWLKWCYQEPPLRALLERHSQSALNIA